MKVCPNCNESYSDDTLNYCLNDGTVLITTSVNQTAEMRQSGLPTANNPPAQFTDFTLNQSKQTFVKPNKPGKSKSLLLVLLLLGGLIFICGGGGVGLYFLMKSQDIFTQNNNTDIYSQNTNGGQNRNQSSNNPVADDDQSDSNGLTIEKFMQIKSNSSYKQAVEILGTEGEQMSSSGSGTYKTEMYQWSNGNGGFIFLMFINDKLTSKTQNGLNERITESLTLDKFNQLQDGMKYEEVSGIIGEGDLQSSMFILGSTFDTYQWKADNFSYVSISFQNGKLNSKSQFGLK